MIPYIGLASTLTALALAGHWIYKKLSQPL